MSATSRRRPQRKHCNHCNTTYYNDGWHAENCTRPLGLPGVATPLPHHRPAYMDEPEYQREQDADSRERTYEELHRPLTYPEKGITE